MTRLGGKIDVEDPDRYPSNPVDWWFTMLAYDAIKAGKIDRCCFLIIGKE
jgi:hypothetical protein